MERQRTNEGTPFSAVVKVHDSITQEVLAVNSYLMCNSNDSEGVERTRFAGSRMQKPHPEKGGARGLITVFSVCAGQSCALRGSPGRQVAPAMKNCAWR